MLKDKLEREAIRCSEQAFFVSPQWAPTGADLFKKGANWAIENMWISVTDDLPELGKSVIVCNEEDPEWCWFGHRTESEDVVKDENDFAIVGNLKITHWMEVPKLKKQ